MPKRIVILAIGLLVIYAGVYFLHPFGQLSFEDKIMFIAFAGGGYISWLIESVARSTNKRFDRVDERLEEINRKLDEG